MTRYLGQDDWPRPSETRPDWLPEPPPPLFPVRLFTEDALVARGGLCTPMSPLYDPWRSWFAPVPFWRNWWRRWDAGGPLLGHVTPPRFRLRLPTFTASRGGIRYVPPPWS